MHAVLQKNITGNTKSKKKEYRSKLSLESTAINMRIRAETFVEFVAHKTENSEKNIVKSRNFRGIRAC